MKEKEGETKVVTVEKPPITQLFPVLFNDIFKAKARSWTELTGTNCFHAHHEQGPWNFFGNIGKVTSKLFF